MAQRFVLIQQGWQPWIFFYFTVTGSLALVSVLQPLVLPAARGQDVVLSCSLQLSSDETLKNLPVLYWMHQTREKEVQVWKPSEAFEGRVEHNNAGFLNQSIKLKDVRWADGGIYLCKFSVTTEKQRSFRSFGNKTTLGVYDHLFFNLTDHNDSLLLCEANATRDAGFSLAIYREGLLLQGVDSPVGGAVTALPFITLSQTVSLAGGGNYECRLRLRSKLVTQSILYLNRTDAEVPPEPWLLYGALLLVPVAFLLALTIVSWMCRQT